MAQVKGAVIVDSVRYLRRHKEAARRLLPPELHHYLSQRVLMASWYPEEHLVPLMRAMARIDGQPDDFYFQRAGRITAHVHAGGVYRHLVHRSDRESLSRRALVLWAAQHDTGSMEMMSVDNDEVRVALRDFGVPSREFCLITGGYLAATFEISGCEDVRIAKESCCVDGDAECAWLVSWGRRR